MTTPVMIGVTIAPTTTTEGADAEEEVVVAVAAVDVAPLHGKT